VTVVVVSDGTVTGPELQLAAVPGPVPVEPAVAAELEPVEPAEDPLEPDEEPAVLGSVA